jgi:hypothetical protein
MGKVTSEDFLHGGMDSRVPKYWKTWIKVRSQSWSKTGSGQHLKSRKHRYTSKSSLQQGQKRYPKWGSKMALKLCAKPAKNGNRISRIRQNRRRFPKSSIKQAISGALTNRKGGVKMRAKPGAKRGQKSNLNGVENGVKTGREICR